MIDKEGVNFTIITTVLQIQKCKTVEDRGGESLRKI